MYFGIWSTQRDFPLPLYRIVAMPDFRNALERSVWTKGEWKLFSRGRDPLIRFVLKVARILLCRMLGESRDTVTSPAQSNRRVHEYRDSLDFMDCTLLKPSLAEPFDLPSYYVYFTSAAEARAKVLPEYAGFAR